MARIRTNSRVQYYGENKKYRHEYGIVLSSKYDPFLRKFTYIVQMEKDGKILRFFDSELDSYNNFYDDCECGGIYLDIEHHSDWCPLYSYYKSKEKEKKEEW